MFIWRGGGWTALLSPVAEILQPPSEEFFAAWWQVRIFGGGFFGLNGKKSGGVLSGAVFGFKAR